MSVSPPPLVQLRALVKRYGAVLAADGIDLTVAPGEIVGLLGPNGAGKTTTLECLLGLRAPDSGEVRLDGFDVGARPTEARRRVGAQIQPAAFQDKITPREALAFFASFYPHTKSLAAASPNFGNRAERPAAFITELLARFGLTEKADAWFDTLSSGQRQRLSVAAAFVNQPALLVLDEPTTGLDPQTRRALHQIIADHRATGGSVLLSTHDLDEAQRLCDRVAIVHRGRIVADDRPAALIACAGGSTRIVFRTARPLHDFAAAAVGATACDNPTDALAPRENRHHLRTREPARTIAALTQLIETAGNELIDLQLQPPSLEDAFVALTGEGWDAPAEPAP